MKQLSESILTNVDKQAVNNDAANNEKMTDWLNIHDKEYGEEWGPQWSNLGIRFQKYLNIGKNFIEVTKDIGHAVKLEMHNDAIVPDYVGFKNMNVSIHTDAAELIIESKVFDNAQLEISGSNLKQLIIKSKITIDELSLSGCKNLTTIKMPKVHVNEFYFRYPLQLNTCILPEIDHTQITQGVYDEIIKQLGLGRISVN